MIEEPLLMQNQNGAFNQDIYAQKEVLKLKKAFGLKYAVETGTCLGYTTEFLSKHFEKVKTVEINDTYFSIAYTNRIKYCKNVEMTLGSSVDHLLSMLQGVDHGTLIFLDAHWQQNCPLKQELFAISESGLKPVIAIHDFFVPGLPELGYDSIDDQPLTYEWLKNDIQKIYGKKNYHYYYNKKAVGAKRGIIYITPKTFMKAGS